MRLLAHAGLDATLLLLLGLGAGIVSYRRLRGRGLEEMSRRTAWLLALFGAGSIALAIVVSLAHADGPGGVR